MKPFGNGKDGFGFDVAFGLKHKSNKGVMNVDPKYGRFKAEYVQKNMTDYSETELELDFHRCRRTEDFLNMKDRHTTEEENVLDEKHKYSSAAIPDNGDMFCIDQKYKDQIRLSGDYYTKETLFRYLKISYQPCAKDYKKPGFNPEECATEEE